MPTLPDPEAGWPGRGCGGPGLPPDGCGLVCRLEAAEEVGAAGGASPEFPPECGVSAGPEQQQDSDGERDAEPEQAQTIYRDIWSLRASLELHAATASDHSSSGNDRDSVKCFESSLRKKYNLCLPVAEQHC